MEVITSYEKELIVNNKELIYDGIFKADEIFALINKTLEERGYTKNEKKSEELVTPLGRMHILELRPYKEITKYALLMIKIKISLDNVTEAKEESQGQFGLFQKGDVKIAFDAWVMTDYQHRWGMKPFVFFMKGIINKFVYKTPIENNLASQVGSDTVYIFSELRKLLKSYTGKEERFSSEEDVKREIAKDVGKTL